MFKRIEIWILYLIVLLGLIFCLTSLFALRYEIEGGKEIPVLSKLGKISYFFADIPYQLKRILYGVNSDLKYVDRFPGINKFNGIAQKDEKYLLLSRFDGRLKESVVELVDLRSFNVIHTWNPNVDSLNGLLDPNKEKTRDILANHSEIRFRLMHPFLTDSGGLIFKSLGSQLIKIDINNNLVWYNSENVFSHSTEVDSDNNFWIPMKLFPHTFDKKIVGDSFGSFEDDAIAKISKDGNILYHKSVSQILIENNMEYLLFSYGNYYEKDPVHLNDIQPVMFSSPYWEMGDVFISLRNISSIMLYRPSTNKIVWHGSGYFNQQHDIDILDENRIAIFNNNVKNSKSGKFVDGVNEIIIYDFFKNEYSKYLEGSLNKYDVKTRSAGLFKILPNGDLFLEEQNFSRLLYFDKDGDLLWQYVNRSDDNNVYGVYWSRILHKEEDINKINNSFILK